VRDTVRYIKHTMAGEETEGAQVSLSGPAVSRRTGHDYADLTTQVIQPAVWGSLHAPRTCSALLPAPMLFFQLTQ
jgi:hypothetical protein